MKKLLPHLKKVLFSYRLLPEKKQYIEFFSAILTIPVLVTVILLNLNNLNSVNKNNDADSKSSSEASQQANNSKSDSATVNTASNTISQNTSASQATTDSQDASGDESESDLTRAQCKPEIGPISITSPQEDEVITDNPVSITVNYKKGDYCAAVWSYRINNGKWSDYDDKSIALYSLPQGNVKVDLKVKSIIGDEEQILSRNFVYKGDSMASTPTTQPDLQNTNTSSGSAN